AKAARLAKLSGAELGRVVGIREIFVPGDKTPATPMPYYFYGAQAAGADEEVPRKRLEASRFQGIPVRVELQVRFDLAPPDHQVARPRPQTNSGKVTKRGAE